MRKDDFHDRGTEKRWANYCFACGIYFGLIGEAKKAHEWLEDVRKQQPKYEGIDDALKALDEPSKPVTPQPRP
jgi:hypothetical protein